MKPRKIAIGDLQRILKEAAGEVEGLDEGAEIIDLTFAELGLDSIALLETGGQIERQHGIRLADDAIMEAETPRALLKVVNDVLAASDVEFCEEEMPTRPGRVVLVTGATSGIGFAVARTFAELGDRVFLCSRSAESVKATVEELRGGNSEVDGTTCDVRSKADVHSFVCAAVDRFGSVEVLVNNAGRSGGGATADLRDDLWTDVVDTNLNSVFYMTREVLNTGRMRDRSRGRIINIASTAGKQGVVLGAPYSASKHGVVGFTKAVGNELAPTGITVNAVCPGYVETAMARLVRQRYATVWNTTEEDVLSRFEAKIPLGRYSTPQEVASLVAYLASDEAGSITAQAINVCGGLGNF